MSDRNRDRNRPAAATTDGPTILVVGDSHRLDRTADTLASVLESTAMRQAPRTDVAREYLATTTGAQAAADPPSPVHCLVCEFSTDATEESRLAELTALESDDAGDGFVTDLPPIVALAAPDDAEAALDAGATDVFTPADPAAVVAARVKSVADRQRAVWEAERTRREQRSRSERTQTILQNTTAPILVLTETGEIRTATPAIESQTGHAPPVLEGERLSAFVHPDDRERLRHAVAAVADGSVGATERVRLRLRTAGGTWRVVELVCVSRLSDPTLEGIVATVEPARLAHDGDDPAETDERTALDGLPVACCSLGPDWELQWANDAARRFLRGAGNEQSDGVRARGALEDTVIWDLLPAALRETFYERLHEASATETPVQFETPSPAESSVVDPAPASTEADNQSNDTGRLLVTAAPDRNGVTLSIHESRSDTLGETTAPPLPAADRERLALLSELVDALQDGVAVLDDDTVEFANTALCELADTDSLAGTAVEALFDDDLAAAVLERANAPVIRWMDAVEGELLGSRGDRQPVDVLVTPLSAADRTLCVVRDRRQSAAGSLSRLAAMLDSLDAVDSRTAVYQTVVDGVRAEAGGEFAGWYRLERAEEAEEAAEAAESAGADTPDDPRFRPVAIATGPNVPRIDPPPVERDALAFVNDEGDESDEDGEGDEGSEDDDENEGREDDENDESSEPTDPPTVRLVDDTTASSFLSRSGLRAARVLAVPITDEDVVVVTGSDPLAFDALDTEPVASLAAAGSVALESTLARERSRESHRERERLAGALSVADAVMAAERELLAAESRDAVEQRLCEVVGKLPTAGEVGVGEVGEMGKIGERAEMSEEDESDKVSEANNITPASTPAPVSEFTAPTTTPSLVWFGRIDAGSETVTPQAWAGDRAAVLDAGGDADRPSLTVDSSTVLPAARTGATQTPTVVDDYTALADSELDSTGRAWYRTLRDAGVRSVVSVPVEYGGISYGTLTVYADRPDAFDERTRRAYSHLGDVAGYAIGALARTQALLTDRVTELEVVLRESNDPLAQVASRLGRGLDVRAVVPRSGGGSTVYCTTRNTDADGETDAAPTGDSDSVDVAEDGDANRRVNADEPLSPRLESATDLEGVASARLVGDEPDQTDHGDDSVQPGSPLEVVLESESLADVLAAHGGVLHSVMPLDGRTRLVLTVPGSDSATTPVRSIVERLEREAVSARLLARRERDARPRSVRAFDAELRERLSDRQWRTLEAAYYGGFFAWPRESTGEEIADSLAVSQPTFSRHLRAAQRKLFELLFDQSA
ncbi:PAS/PAC sensor protein [Natrialba hulunbeirensis JCM 10989]|uniref:PAS/PAC sensor protein n=1 Tax=Natrialba hulunbeirensis JCM 10989 TaxID=1227493 RepID=L9ZNI6_9EURY|nr:bacterio-opsin activator domain-containing protein [Natrialba hulunbeirensis]ELY87924.1 PAS/PAC sensor protein [Natrialba hulunbeirensis JCM 10989]